MSVFITFAAALLIFGAVIAIHEFGHFAVAKLCGVQVNEFSIGMGPTLIKTYRKGTQYTLRLLPVGGFVALEGEESPESEQAEGGSGDNDGPDIPPEVLEQRTGKPLNEAAVWQRMLVMAAGAVMNFVLGFVVLLLLISLRSEPITSKVIYAVEDNALCGQTGLQAGLAAEGVVLHGIDDLAGDGLTAQRDEEQQHHEAQHEVHHRACRHHQHPLPDSRLVQRLACPLLQHLRRDVRAVIVPASTLGLLALGALLPFQRHKAAYGQEPQGILCAFAIGLDEGRTHANGKLVDLDPAELCHCKMAELVDGDDRAEDEQRGCKGDEN